jgi:hypothetical protein
MSNTISALKIYAILFTLVNTVNAADRYSIANGNWNTGTTWSNTLNGTTCNCTPVKSDNIYVNHNVTLDKNLTGGGQGLTGILSIGSGANLNGGGTYSIEIRTGGWLTVSGSLTVSSLTYYSSTVVLINSGAMVTVNAGFTNRMGSNNVTINGTATVNGTFDNQSSGVILGTGSIGITNGPVTNGSAATIFGISSANPCSSFPCTLPVPLPIELMAFDASRNGRSVEVKWATATETNNDYFTVERSRDLLSWVEVAKVKGAGNSTHILHYTCNDTEPVMTDCYYRLRQTDFDGSHQFFDPVFVEGMDDYVLRLYPNPSSDNKVTVSLQPNDMHTAVIKVYDMTGSEVKAKLSPDWSQSVIYIEIDADAVKSARMFYVTMISGDRVLREKLVINY